MKTTLYCLAIATALRLAFGQIVSSPTQFVSNGDRVVMFKGKIAGDFRNWLTIESHNGQQWRENGYDPIYVRVLSDYKPLFRHLPNGQWEIMFTSPIAENIP